MLTLNLILTTGKKYKPKGSQFGFLYEALIRKAKAGV